MSQNGQTHFKNIASDAARFLKCVWHFGKLCIKGLRQVKKGQNLLVQNFKWSKLQKSI